MKRLARLLKLYNYLEELEGKEISSSELYDKIGSTLFDSQSNMVRTLNNLEKEGLLMIKKGKNKRMPFMYCHIRFKKN